MRYDDRGRSLISPNLVLGLHHEFDDIGYLDTRILNLTSSNSISALRSEHT
jgi:hypothetical protein